MNDGLVTVLTPNLNFGRFLPDAIASVEQQSVAAHRHLVIDGASTDNSHEVLKASGVDWSSKSDASQAEALNRGLERIDTEYTLWLNSDEFLFQGAIAKLTECAARNPEASVIYGDSIYVDESGKISRGFAQHPFSLFALKWHGCYIATCAALFRTSALKRVGGLRETSRTALDWDLFLRLALTGHKFAYTPAFVGAFRVHDSQITAQQTDFFNEECVSLLQRHGVSVRGWQAKHHAGVALHRTWKVVNGSVYRQRRLLLQRGTDARWWA